MSRFSEKRLEMKDMDMLAAQTSMVHSLNPLSKLLVTLCYIMAVVSFPKYNLSGLMPMILYPVLMYQLAGIPVSLCFVELKVVLPLVCAVGIVNPFFDDAPVLQIGNVVISGGILSMLTLMLNGIFSLMASFLLIATTSIDSVCAALRKVHVPDMMVTLLLLTYRYVGMMIEEVGVMYDAYMLRAPGQKGIHVSAWGSFLGQLLLRAMDRGEELYNSMLLRGYCGEFPHAAFAPFNRNSGIYSVLCIISFWILRTVNLAELLGAFFVR